MYYHSHQKNKSRFRLPLQIIGMGILTLIISGVGLFYLRTSQKNNAAKNNTSEIVAESGEVVAAPIVVLAKQTTVVKSLSSNLEVGAAERGIEKGILYHTIKVSLPEINRETEFYEGWLVRQAPYDFFSTGEMVTDDDGDFVLEWAGEHSDIVSYDRVIITREARDDIAAPSEQVAEGVFGETEGVVD
ncbi:MAG: hypothetical protein WC702_01705 [Patescibacteria group bacterium]|jgi:hypothetical protein